MVVDFVGMINMVCKVGEFVFGFVKVDSVVCFGKVIVVLYV